MDGISHVSITSVSECCLRSSGGLGCYLGDRGGRGLLIFHFFRCMKGGCRADDCREGWMQTAVPLPRYETLNFCLHRADLVVRVALRASVMG